MRVNYNQLVNLILSHFLYDDDVSVFSNLKCHIADSHANAKRKEFLIQSICDCYLKVRFHHAAKVFTEQHQVKCKGQSRSEASSTTKRLGL